MASFLNDRTSTGLLTSTLSDALNVPQPQGFQQDGFIVPPIPSADGKGLPSSKIPALRQATTRRNIAHWFVPEVGVVNMYVNPQKIDYGLKKLITQERTKGGYLLAYWGEQLTTLSISGHTGSSGVEGLNVLQEIYRAEQYLFDSLALTMAADTSITGLNDIIDSSLGNLGGFASTLATGTLGLLGLDPASQNILPQNVPSLASIAFGIEFYYAGWVFRGYFDSFTFHESAERLGLFDYEIQFVATQRRGYRVNSYPWQRSAISGPSNSDTVPLSVRDIQGTNNFNQTPANPLVAGAGRGPFSQ
jgi:hypothetical protein